MDVRRPTATRVHEIAPFHVMEVQTAARALEAAGRDVVHMEIGEPDFPTPEPVLAAARAALDAGTTRVVLAAGELPALDPSREARWIDRLVREGRTDALAAEIAAALAADRSARDRFVEALCRSLFDLARAVPDAQWLLATPSSISGFPTPAEAESVFGELPGRRIGYWHDAARAARLAALGAILGRRA